MVLLIPHEALPSQKRTPVPFCGLVNRSARCTTTTKMLKHTCTILWSCQYLHAASPPQKHNNTPVPLDLSTPAWCIISTKTPQHTSTITWSCQHPHDASIRDHLHKNAETQTRTLATDRCKHQNVSVRGFKSVLSAKYSGSIPCGCLIGCKQLF